jgi:opacity protein-like surface antigen
MKKIVFILLPVFFATSSYAQTRAGDLTVGARGAYISMYKSLTYGLEASYQITDPLEVSLSGMLNPNIKYLLDRDRDRDYRKVSFYSGSLDLRFYLLNMEVFGMGPALGGQTIFFKSMDSTSDVRDEDVSCGFNIGWHIRMELSENMKLNGGWRYTTATEDRSHHSFYLGIGYTFHLF